jgi:hypothetical protein
MPFNIPTVTTSNISFGPAVLKIAAYTGATCATPSVDIGSITEDGASVEMTADKRYVAQGNPRLNIFGFTQVQSVSLSITGIEWNFDNFRYAIGSGGADTSTNPQTFGFGGDPACIELGLLLEHTMPNTNLIKIYIWKAVSESGITLPFGQDEHSFEYKFNALYQTQNWAGTTLPDNQYLMKMSRSTS